MSVILFRTILKALFSRSSVVILVCIATGCATINYSDGFSSTENRQSIVVLAKKQIGDKYKYGSRGPDRFDCSGLVSFIYQNNGINISGSSSSMAQAGSTVKHNDALPGDLIFFKKSGKIFHVSIISQIIKGEIWAIHSTSSRGVIEENISSSGYWSPKMHKIISLASLK